MNYQKICVIWDKKVRSGAIFSISLICKSEYKKLFVFKEKIEVNDLERFRHFLFIDKFSGDSFSNKKVINSIQILTRRSISVSYLDTSDSPEIKYIQYVNLFAHWFKKQMYSNKQNYDRELLGGRLYSDYYARAQSMPSEIKINNQSTVDYSKIKLYWNILLGPYPLTTFKTRVMRYGVKYLGLLYLKMFNYSIINKDVSKKSEKVFVSQRIGNSNLYTGEVGYQRKIIADILDKRFNDSTSRVTQRQYNREMKKSLFTVSPFGWGEICHRDAEAFMYGSLLIKPNMDHILTQPDLYLKNFTYIDSDWDCKNLVEKIDDVVNNEYKYSEIARRGMNLFYRENRNFNMYVGQLYNQIVNAI